VIKKEEEGKVLNPPCESNQWPLFWHQSPKFQSEGYWSNANQARVGTLFPPSSPSTHHSAMATHPVHHHHHRSGASGAATCPRTPPSSYPRNGSRRKRCCPLSKGDSKHSQNWVPLLQDLKIKTQPTTLQIHKNQSFCSDYWWGLSVCAWCVEFLLPKLLKGRNDNLWK